ncbi:FecR domain-containing protein [Thalassospira xiamenensis]|uniref:FecR family protein n=1 Tax=Thalassospira xiamenensis TaxID=220697 RepID=UPI0015F0DA08|nr:FecR domain-containing protein [Thalassospira xiamenensis]
MTGTHYTGQNPETAAKDDLQDRLVDQAMEWLARDGVDIAGTETHEAFQKWCGQSTAHEQAARSVRAFLDDRDFDDILRKFDAGPESTTRTYTASGVLKISPPTRRSLRPVTAGMPLARKAFWGGVALCAAILVAVLTLRPADHSDHPGYIAANTTPVSQILPDGSELQLARGTRLYWEFSKQERHIVLDQGAVVISAAPNKDRELVVTTPQSRVVVVGTRFVVIGDAETSEVGVAEGTVRVVQKQSPPAREVTLHAGDGVTVSGNGDVRRRDFDGENITQILDGWRVFSSAKLSDVVHAISRQSGTEIWLDSGLADLEIRGRFNVADVKASLDLISRTTGTRIIELPFDHYLLAR